MSENSGVPMETETIYLDETSDIPLSEIPPADEEKLVYPNVDLEMEAKMLRKAHFVLQRKVHKLEHRVGQLEEEKRRLLMKNKRIQVTKPKKQDEDYERLIIDIANRLEDYLITNNWEKFNGLMGLYLSAWESSDEESTEEQKEN